MAFKNYFDYESDVSAQSSAYSISTNELNNHENEFEEEGLEVEDYEEEELFYTIPFEKIKTKRGRDAIILENETYVFKRHNKKKTIYWRCRVDNCPASATTSGGFGCLSGESHIHEKLTENEVK
ncbi:unnamed protein product [Brachionus calyciflorus]|uniref:FLYWCH-type domain-containing protein n=1 Tax=Brachionus calyciflorus TaxID=104777 RepID=A0A813MCE8_9BILA|nr:unnamed protein product [Brachionus calyciflorus]